MPIQLASTDELQVVLDAAPTNQLPINASYVDQGGSGGNLPSVTAGVTPVTFVASPASGVERLVSQISIPNVDIATRIITINLVRSGTAHEILSYSVASGYHLFYDGDWRVNDNKGNFLCNVTVTGGTLTANQGAAAALSGAWPVEVTDGTNVLGTASHPIRNDPTGTTTQPISGTVTTTPPANASTNITQFGGISLSTGIGASGTGIPRVTVSNDSTHPVTQSGAWAVTLSAGSAAIGTVGVTSLPALPAGSNAIGSVTVSNTVATSQGSGNWNDNVAAWGGVTLTSASSSAYGTAPTGTVPGVNANITNSINIYNAPFTLTGAFSITTTAHTFVTTGLTKLRLVKIDLYGYVNASGNSLMLVDGSGATIFNIAIPAIATALTDTNFFFSELLNISMNNASGGMTCSLANNPSSGSVFAQFGVSN